MGAGERRCDRSAGSCAGPFELSCWQVDPATRQVSDGIQSRRISPKAMGVLIELVAASGRVVSRDALLDSVWPDVVVGEESLTHAVSDLRRAFCDPPNRPWLIETVHKSGYRLLVEAIPTETPDPLAQYVIPPGDDFDLDAYVLCLESRQVIERSGVGSLERAVELCAEAVARAPQFAFAQAEYAIAIVNRCLYGDQGGPSLEAAAEAAGIAVRLRPDQATNHAALGFALAALGRYGPGRRAFIDALARDTDNFEAHYLFARAEFSAGEMAAAARLAERAGALCPDDYRALYLASGAWAEIGDRSRQRAAASHGLARALRRLEADPDEPRALNVKGSFLARLERYSEALAAVEDYERRGEPLEYYTVATLAWAGETTEALARLESVAERGWRHADWMLVDPSLAPLRGEMKFRKLESTLAA